MSKSNFRLILIFLCTVITCTQCVGNDRPLQTELVANGYKYIIFGSQRTDGIELYDLRESRFIDFLSSKDRKIRYLSPVVDETGSGYCIEERNTFEQDKYVSKLVAFDLRTMKTNLIDTENIYNISTKLALSPDRQKLAYLTLPSFKPGEVTPYLTIFDTGKKKVIKKIAIDKSYFEDSARLVWMPDGNSIAMWTWHPAVVINTTTDETRPITEVIKPIAWHFTEINML